MRMTTQDNYLVTAGKPGSYGTEGLRDTVRSGRDSDSDWDLRVPNYWWFILTDEFFDRIVISSGPTTVRDSIHRKIYTPAF